MPPCSITDYRLNSTYRVFDSSTCVVAQMDKRVDMPTTKEDAEMQVQARRGHFRFKVMSKPADQFRCFYSLIYKHKY